MLRNRFSHPLKFSFKDLLAVLFSGSFLTMIWMLFLWDMGNKDLLDFLKTPLEIILGGYFIHEGIGLYKVYSNSSTKKE